MKVKIDDSVYSIDCEINDRLKIYNVPEEYSEDKIYIARWRNDQVEPVPACLGTYAKLIIDVVITGKQNDEIEFSGFVSQGVKINA